MKSKICFSLLFLVVLFASSQNDRPNVVLVMVDDMGFSDLGCYGGEVETPNLDALAMGGVRFTQFANTARCCPSRASLMTGLYPHAAGMGWMAAVDEGVPAYQGQLRKDRPTIAEVLKYGGYRTYMAGKWHLTVEASYNGGDTLTKPNGSWPHQRGFDRYYGGLSGGGSHYKPKSLVNQDKMIDSSTLPDDFYYTYEVTKRSIDFITDHDFNQPLFLYVAHYAPHRPLQAPQERIDKVRKRYEVGYDILRHERFERQKALGIVAKDVLYGKPYGDPPAWKDLKLEQQEKWIEEMATYAAMIEIVDDGIGEIVGELKRRGQFDNTLFLFLSDNGATAEGGFISQLAANLSNSPYINYKKHTHLGGIASPLIVHSPKSIDLKPGVLISDPAHIIDILPTILDATGVDFPTEFQDKQTMAPSGTSLMPVILGNKLTSRPLFWEHEGNRAIRSGDWKAVAEGVKGDWELYDLSKDPFEQQNLGAQHPERLQELIAQFDNWAEEVGASPLHHEGWKQRIDKYKKLNPVQSGDHVE